MANWWDKYSAPAAAEPSASRNWWDKYAVADDAPDFGDVNSGVSSSAPDPNASFLDSAWRANKAQMGPIFAGNVKRMAAEVSDPIAGLLNGTFGKPAAEDAPELSLTVNPNGNTSLPASPLIAPDAGMALMDAARGEPLRNATLRDLQQSGLAQARAGGAELQQARTDMEVPESGLERYAKLAAISAGPTLAGMTAGIVTKSPAVGAGVSTLFAVPSAYGEARDAGHSVEDAIKYAGVVGGAEVVSERLGFDALLGKLATRLPAGKLATVFGTLEKSIPGRALTGAGVEGTTEALSQAAQNAYKIAGLGEHMTFDEFMTDMKDSFGAGAMIGGPLAGGHAAAQSLAAQSDSGSEEERIRRSADQIIARAERIQTPESEAVDAGRNAAAAIFAEANISNDTGQPIPDPRTIDFTQAVDPETGLPQIGVQPEVMGDLDAMVPSEPEAAPDPVRPAVEPVAQPAQETQGKSIPGLSEPIRSGTRVFYPGDVDAMRAKLDAAGLDAGMRRNNEDGTPAGLYFPSSMQAEVDAVLNPAAQDTRAAQPEPVEPIDLDPRDDAPKADHKTQTSILEVPLSDLTLSKDVPQFKSGAREDGVVEQLGGKFDRRGTGPIQVWRRTDGRMEVISGRHRLDLARRSGDTTIPAQVYDEAAGFTAEQAASLDAELNIRDGQGKVKDYVQFFKLPAFDGEAGKAEADARGLLARATGKRAYTIASKGDPELIAAHSADQLTDEAAVQIAQAAPNNAPLQALGMKLVQEGKSIGIAANTMRAVRSMQGDRPQMSDDMFGFDDSAIQDAVKIAGVASRRQREIGERLAAITGAAKRPDVARREGVDVRDPQALPARIAQLRAEKAEWDDWATDPAKVNEIRAELGMEPQPEFARAEDPAEFVDDVTAPMFSRGLRPRSEMESAPVGAWIDGGNVPGIGPTAFQVRDVPLDKISPVELDSVGDVGPEKRSDVGRYTEAMRRGEQFPNARGYELENGNIKLVDGHRRLLAAKAAGKTSLRIAVNPLDDSAKSAMFSRRPGAASGDMFGGATIEDTNRASPRSRMPETADLFGGPSMQERVGAAERARDAARNSGDGKRADTGDGGLFDGPRPEQAILRSQRKQEDEDQRPDKPTDEGIESNEITGDDADALIADMRARQQRKLDEAADPLTDGFKILGKNPDTFRTQLLPGKTVRELAKQSGANYAGQSNEDGIAVHSVAVEQGDAGPAMAKIYDDGNDVWIDVSGLKSGGGKGDSVYNMAYSYARNNGRNFKEDPAGVSDTAMYRRPVQQLSALLKSGDADNIAPGDFLATQRPGGPNTRPIKAPANRAFDPTLRENILTTYTNALNAVPEIGEIRYDTNRAAFVDASGKPVTDADFDRLASNRRANPIREAMVRVGDPETGQRLEPAPVGGNSLKVAVLAQTLLGASPSQRPALLDGLRKIAAGSLGDSGLSRILPSKNKTPADAGGSRSEPLTRAEIDADVKRVFGTAKPLTRLINSGAVSLITKAQAIQRGLGSAKSLEGVKGLHDGTRGYLITDELQPNEVAGVLIHEIGVHHSMERILGAERFDKLQKAMESFRARGDKDVLAAYAAVPKDTPAHHVNHEAIAYLAEHSANHSITQKLVDATKLFLNRLGVPMSWIKAEPATVRSIARESLLAESRRGNGSVRYNGRDTLYQKVWHGTPHRDIEKTGFSLQKIGTGEGAQAYGWGMYFAGRREVGESYRASTARPEVEIGGRRFKADGGGTYRDENNIPLGSTQKQAYEDASRGLYGSKAGQSVTSLAEEAESYLQSRSWMTNERIAEAKKAILNGEVKLINEGQLYSAEIPEDSDLLDWDKPLSEQPEKVKAALAPLIEQVRDTKRFSDDPTGERIYNALSVRLAEGEAPGKLGRGAKAASEALLRAGIPGLRYLDGGSRRKGEGSANYVIWDETLLTPEKAQITPYYSKRADDEDQTQTPEFKRWFGDSKVVDAQGKPLVVYHGTDREFTEFRMGSAPGWGRGIYFTDNRDQAEADYGGGAGGRVVEAYLSIRNPWRGGFPGYEEVEGTRAWQGYTGRFEDSLDAWDEDGRFAGEVLRELGYDGVIAENSNDIRGLEIVAFDPGQIKSATGNNGQFDPGNPDIRFSRRKADDHGTTQPVAANENVAGNQGQRAAGGDTGRDAEYRAKHRPAADSLEVYDDDGEFKTVKDLVAGLNDGRLLIHIRVKDGTDLKYGIDPSAGEYLRSTEAWQDAAEQFGEGPELIFFSDSLQLADNNHLADIRGGGELQAVFVRKTDSIQKSIGNGRIQTADGREMNYERSPLADYESDLFKSEPAGVERGDWYTNKTQDVVAVIDVADLMARQQAAESGMRLYQPARTDQTQTPEFKRWFAGSKVVDSEGKPLVVYHGGAGGVRVFEPDRAGSVKTADWGSGVYFTPVKWQAQSYMEDSNKAADVKSNALWDKMEETAARHGTGVMYASMDLASKKITQEQYDEIKAIESEWRKARDDAEKNGSGEVYAAYLRIENPLIQQYDGITDPYLREHAEAKGHDGIIIVRDDGSFDEIVAFRPSQIKSATGNSGTFDPADPNIMHSRRTPADAERDAATRRAVAVNTLGGPTTGGAIGWNFDAREWEGKSGTVRRARAALDDKMIAWRDVQDSIAEHLGNAVPDAQNVYRLENLMHGRVKEGIDALEEKQVVPLVKAMQEAKITPAMLEEYLYALHAKERNAQIAKINPKMPDGGSGMTNAEADAILAKPLPNGMKEIAKRAKAIIRQTRKRLLDHGLITQEQFDAMESQYQNYVPLRGKTVGENEFAGTTGNAGRGIDGRPSPVKQAFGRGAGNRAENILGEIIGDAQRSIIAAEKARVGRAVMRIVLANPNPKLWTVEPVLTERKLDSTGEVYEAVVQDWSDPSIVAVRHRGQIYKVQINHAPLAKALNLVGVDQIGAVTRAAGALNRYFSAVLTRYNPAFIPVNAARDALFGLTGLAVEHGEVTAMKAALYYPKAIRAAWREARRLPPKSQADTYAREFSEDGGKTGYVSMPSVEELQRKIGSGRFGGYSPQGIGRAAQAVGDLVGAMNDSVENALRLSAYVTLREQGMAREKAASYAKELTVNFNRKGSEGTKLNSWFLFYNASMQGIKRTGALMKSPKTWGYLGALTAAQIAAVMYAMGQEDDDGTPIWDKVPDHVKQRNLVFTWLDDGGEQKILTIPMPYGLNVFPYFAGRVADGMMHAENRPRDRAMSIAADTVSTAVQSFSPVPLDDGAMGLLPTALRIPLSIQVNRDDFGRQIRKENPFGKFDVPRASIGKPDTLEMFKVMATGLNRIGGGDERTPPPMSAFDVAPEDIEYVLEKLGGGTGKFIIDMATVGQKSTGELPVEARDIPIAKRFFTNVNEPAAQQAMFYERREAIERDADIVRDVYEKDGPEAAIALLRSTPSLSGADFRRYKESDPKKGHRKGGIVVVDGRPQLVVRRPDSVYGRYKAAAEETAEVNGAMRNAYADSPMSLRPSGERDKRLKELADKRMAAQRIFNAAWNRDVVGGE